MLLNILPSQDRPSQQRITQPPMSIVQRLRKCELNSELFKDKDISYFWNHLSNVAMLHHVHSRLSINVRWKDGQADRSTSQQTKKNERQ